MGLDSYLFKRGKTEKGKVYLGLNELKPNRDSVELGYWRKQWEVHEKFCSFGNKEIGHDYNCTDIILSKDNLLDVLQFFEKHYSDDDYTITLLKNVIANTDFDNEEIFYYAWF